MAIVRDHPYGSARFVVQIDGVEEAGFTEVLLPELTLSVVEYREGGDREAEPRLLPGRPGVGRLVLRRGFRGSLSLYQWYRAVATEGARQRRAVAVQLFDEGMTAVVAVWRLRAAWPARYAVSPLRGASGEPLVEEVELVGEQLELE